MKSSSIQLITEFVLFMLPRPNTLTWAVIQTKVIKPNLSPNVYVLNYASKNQALYFVTTPTQSYSYCWYCETVRLNLATENTTGPCTKLSLSHSTTHYFSKNINSHLHFILSSSLSLRAFLTCLLYTYCLMHITWPVHHNLFHLINPTVLYDL